MPCGESRIPDRTSDIACESQIPVFQAVGRKGKNAGRLEDIEEIQVPDSKDVNWNQICIKRCTKSKDSLCTFFRSEYFCSLFLRLEDQEDGIEQNAQYRGGCNGRQAAGEDTRYRHRDKAA